MASKRPLVKQRVTYGFLEDGNLRENEDDFSGKQSLAKRVSFHNHELSDSDSDEENSLGRINRSSSRPARDSLDGLFRESVSEEKESSVGFTKGASLERQRSNDMGQPRPVPRSRPTISAEKTHIEGYSVTSTRLSSDEEGRDMYTVKQSSETMKTKDRYPVPPPRTSARQHTENTSSSNVVSPRPVPRSRIALSPRERQLKSSEQDSVMLEDEKTRRVRDIEVPEFKESRKAAGKPVAPLRRKKTLEETNEGGRSQIPKIRTTTFENERLSPENNDGREIEQDGNLRHGKVKNKVKGQPLVSVTRSDSSEEFESGDDTGIVKNTKGFYSKEHHEEEHSYKKAVTDSSERLERVPPKPSPRSRMKQTHQESEQNAKHVKRPDSAPVMKKASSLETLQSKHDSFSEKDISVPKEQGAQRVELKKSLTPQRPVSAKKSSWMGQHRVQSDITDTFEEHVPVEENIITGNQNERSSRTKKGSDFESGGGRGRSGPLKANHTISQMIRSPNPRETQADVWAETSDASHGQTLTTKRSLSLTNLRGTSPELWSESGSARSSPHSGLMDTKSIRQAVFDEWKSKKSERLREQMAIKSVEKKKLEEKEKEERQRRKDAKRAFESWNERKQEVNKEKNAKVKEMMNKELEKQKEQNLRAGDAKKYFESWKAKKDEELKEKHHKKKEEVFNKKKKNEEEQKVKTVDSQKAFDNWKKKKDEKLTEKYKKKRREENNNSMKEEEQKYERSIQCAEHYQAWVEKKGKPRRGPPPPTLIQRSWCPSGRKSGNCIPDKVGAVIQAPSPNRSRTMSGSYYFKTNKF